MKKNTPLQETKYKEHDDGWLFTALLSLTATLTAIALFVSGMPRGGLVMCWILVAILANH